MENKKEFELVENRVMRESMIGEVGVLDKVKDLLLLPNTEYATTDQVADYYEVDIEAVNAIVNRHKDELETDGFKLVKKDVIERNVQGVQGVNITQHQGYMELDIDDRVIKIANRGARLFPKRAVVRVAFLLSDSKIAHQVRKELLKSNPSEYYRLSNANLIRVKKYEQDMECFLKALFGSEFVKSQVRCGKYILDFIVHDVVHIEVDENGHSGYDEEYEEARERHILNNTDYYTFRFNPHKDSRFEMVMNIVELFNNIGYPEEISFENNIA